MTVLRTPDERFAGLLDYPFAPHYQEGPDGLRIHYLDEGTREGPTVLLLHGEPSWSYLYRHMLPPLAAAGCRVLAPDLVGFGRSDKPADPDAHTYEAHVAWMGAWLRAVDPREVTLFCQDWGGLIGLRLVAAEPERFAAVVASNTGLPTGAPPGPGFAGWLAFSQSVPTFPVGQILDNGSSRTLRLEEVAAYDAPFPNEGYKAAARRLPLLVPITPDAPSVAENQAAWAVLERFDRPFVTAFSDQDPVTAGGERMIQSRIAGAAGQPHVTIAGGGHFVQEDAPQQLVEVILGVLRRSGRR